MNIANLIQTIGLAGLFAIIYAESGLFLGFFLPGDSLLFTAGFLASQDLLPLPILVIVCFLAAVLGDSTGYMFGKRFGKKIFKKEDSIFFHKDHIIKAQKYYEKNGPKTIVIARFIPIIRTFAPIVAGIGDMHYPTFLKFNILGGLLWVTGLNLAGYFLGHSIPDVDKYILPIIALIITVSLAPNVVHVLKDEKTRSAIMEETKKLALKFRW
jgi:membrane-associated protein